jgi:hypothetical protein
MGIFLLAGIDGLFGHAVLLAQIADRSATVGLRRACIICSSVNVDRFMGPLL